MDDIKTRLLEDEQDAETLKRYELTRKMEATETCPNLINLSYIDEIRRLEQSENGIPIMIAHTEIPTRGKEEQTFLVSQEISETGDPKCVYEYTNTQKNHLISTGMDGKNPFTYREMEDYLSLQRTSLKMIKTEKKCGARGVIISKENTRKIDMNRDDEVADRIIGRASCARSCYAENERYKFLLLNSMVEKQDQNCLWWSFMPENNTCFLHTGALPEISQDYRRAGSVYGKETYANYNSIFGVVGCLDSNDHTEAFILLDGALMNIQELCQYIPHSSSDLQEQINHRCMNDFVYKKKILMSQRKIMSKINKMLEPTQFQTRRQKRMAAVAAFLPGLAQALNQQ